MEKAQRQSVTKSHSWITGIIILLIFCAGCSTSGNTIDPGVNIPESGAFKNPAHGNRNLWGLWDFRIDPENGESEVVPLRSAEFTCNVVNFLQPPMAPINMLTRQLVPGESDIPNGYFVFDISLRHPFPGTRFCGFDVLGIVLDNYPSWTFQSDQSLSVSLPHACLLQNPDGYTRWWNQAEFTTYGTLLGYIDGNMAMGDFDCVHTLNPFKYFSDDTDTDEFFDPDPNIRGFFSSIDPGINTRRYRLQFDKSSGATVIEFKYAVSACYAGPPVPDDPPYVPEMYPITANMPEAYRIEYMDVESTAFYVSDGLSGGDLDFLVEVRDWQMDGSIYSSVMSEIGGVKVESPTLFDIPVDLDVSAFIAVPSDPTVIRIPGHIDNVTPDGIYDQYLMITVESGQPTTYAPEIPGLIGFEYPDAPLAAFNIIEVPISADPVIEECEGADESEPNSEDCSVADQLVIGTDAYGCVQEDFDPIDYWRFELIEDAKVNIHAYNDGAGDIDLGYNDSNCEWLGGSGLHGEGEDEYMEGLYLAAGTYHVHVTADNDCGPYEPERHYHLSVSIIHEQEIPEIIGQGKISNNDCLQVNSEGYPEVFFREGGTNYLGYAKYDGYEWVDLTDEYGIYSAEGLDLDGDGNPHIVYGASGYASTNYAVDKGSGWVRTPVYNPWPGTDSSIELDSLGFPHLAIHGGGGGGQGVWHYWFDGDDWNEEHFSPGIQLIGPNIAIDNEDFVHIFTHEMYSPPMWHFYQNESGWQSEELEPGGNMQCAKFDSENHIHLAYSTGTGGAAFNHLGYIYFDGDEWTTEYVVDDAGDMRGCSLVIDSGDRPHISYVDRDTNYLKYAYYDGSGWNETVVIDECTVNGRTSIAMLPGDVPIIVYNDFGNGLVKCVVIE